MKEDLQLYTITFLLVALMLSLIMGLGYLDHSKVHEDKITQLELDLNEFSEEIQEKGQFDETDEMKLEERLKEISPSIYVAKVSKSKNKKEVVIKITHSLLSKEEHSIYITIPNVKITE